MEQMRELTPEEMDMISGGLHDQPERRRYELFGEDCPYCKASFNTEADRDRHIAEAHPDKVDNPL